MDGSRGAFGHTLAAQAAQVEVDICQIVLYLDGSEGAGLLAFAAAYAGGRARLAGGGAFLLVAAGDIHAAVFHAFLAQFDDAARTGLDAGPAGGALLFVHHGQPRLGVDAQGSELACIGAYTLLAKEQSFRPS